MAAGNPPPPFYVQYAIDNPKTFAHHSSVTEFWKTKWRPPCTMKDIYPFVDGKVEDFDPIFEQLVKDSGDDVQIFHNPDAYARPFMPVAEKLVKDAESAEQDGDTTKAKELYLRAGAVYRIARFPINRTELSQRAWELGKDAYMKGGKYLDPPNHEVKMPFKHANTSSGDMTHDIPAYLRVPTGQKPSGGWPILLFICGLDAYRTDHTNRSQMHVDSGFACLSLEIPGTGDCPAARNDPHAPDRLWSSVFDWIASTGKQEHGLDPNKVIARGVSTGGLYSFRIAHTHADRLIGSVSQGGGCHYMFTEQWIRAQNHMEYPFALSDALAYKFGYKSVEEYINDNPKAKFSLADNNVLDRPSCRHLIVNGLLDSIFPIEDSILVATRGRVKDVRLMEGKYHVGNPGAEQIILDWTREVLNGNETNIKTFKA